MAAEILDGKRISQEMRGELKTEVEGLAAKGITPGLGVILVGEDPASRSYVAAKEKACADVGIFSLEASLPTDASRQEILDRVQAYNNDERIDGILVQLPLPDASIEEEVLNAVLPGKDVDGFHPVNVGRMMLGLPTLLPCTPHGILHMLKRSGAEVSGAHVVVIGRSNIVGRPIANMLSQKSELGNATVTLCHTGTRDMGAFTREADILITAVGRPHTVSAGMVKAGAVVIDVGVNRVEDATRKRGYRLVGDVDYDEVAEKASMITPVPGGVGPMTITMLLVNTVQAAQGRLS
ncbi:MAG: bifunctional methylenetetrahydrofolate dehydrogenase/methenyltetrahydrofolate cyclohydrolase FolD [Verrucomicrobiota bacterium]|jgi:methylenetetrahydrofolate dehydrogenase (NADP+)/methenyltetrahydrofolate cyclohydrolase